MQQTNNSQIKSKTSTKDLRSLLTSSSLPSSSISAPPLSKRMLPLYLTSASTPSFTQKKKQMERQRREEMRRNKIDQNFLLFMARLHEQYAKKQSGPPPRKSPESIKLNVSDSCFLPTVLTSDPTVESEHDYSELGEEELKQKYLPPSKQKSQRKVKKSLIPVRSPHRATNNKGRIDVKVSNHSIKDHVLCNHTTPVPVDVAKSNSYLMGDTGDRIIHQSFSKGTHSLHSLCNEPLFGIKRSAPTVIDGQKQAKSSILLTSSRNGKAQTDGIAYFTETRSGDTTAGQTQAIFVSSKTFGEHLKSDTVVCGTDSIQGSLSHIETNPNRSHKLNTFTLQSKESEPLLKCRGETDRKLNRRALRNALTIVQRSMESMPLATCITTEQAVIIDRPKSVIERYHPKDSDRIIKTSSTVDKIAQSLPQLVVPYQLTTHAEQAKSSTKDMVETMKPDGVYHTLRQRKPSGRRSRSQIPVWRRSRSEKAIRKEILAGIAKEKPVQSEYGAHSGDNILSWDIRQRDMKKVTADGKETYTSQLLKSLESPEHAQLKPTITKRGLTELTASTINAKAKRGRINKPPLPARLRSNMSCVKPQISRSPPRRPDSTKLSPYEVHVNTKCPFNTATSSVVSSRKQLWTKQSTVARDAFEKRTASFTETKSLKELVKQKDGSYIIRNVSSWSPVQESPLSNLKKSSAASSLTNSKSSSTESSPCNQRTSTSNKTQEKADSITLMVQSQPTENQTYDGMNKHGFKQRKTKSFQKEDIKSILRNTRMSSRQKRSRHTSISPAGDQIKDADDDTLRKKTSRYSSNRSNLSLEKTSRIPSRTTRERSLSPDYTTMLKHEITTSSEIQNKRFSPRRLPIKRSTKRVTDGKESYHTVQEQTINTQSALKKSKVTGNYPLEVSTSTTGRSHSKEKGSDYKRPVKTKSEKSDLNWDMISLHCRESPTVEQIAESSSWDDFDLHVSSSVKDIGKTDEKISHNEHRVDGPDYDDEKTGFYTERSPRRFNKGRRKSKRRRTVNTGMRHKSVAWDTGESDGLLMYKRSRKQRKDMAVDENFDNEVKSVRPSLQHSPNSENVGQTSKRQNRLMPSQKDLETSWSDDSLPSVAFRTSRGNEPLGGTEDWHADNNEWTISSPSATKLGTSDHTDVPEKVDEHEDEMIQADMEEVLTQLYQNQSKLIHRMITIQDNINQLRQGLTLFESPASSAKDGQKFEGTYLDYLLLLGFMVIQFCIQYMLLKK